jgi:threonine dehydrogenase-like Zn-dependent dehydrogenase
MRMTVYSGWLMVALGVVIGGGAVVIGQAGFGAIMLVSLAGSGAFMVWLSDGWDKPLEDASELYKYGRPANAVVEKVEEETLRPDGVRTAKMTLKVSPVNESSFRTTRVLALPKARVPAVGELMTVKFDPQSRKNVVLLEEEYEVVDNITAAMRNFA